MLAWITRIVVLFGILTAIYLALSLYNRWAERKRLRAEFEALKTAREAPPGDAESFVDQGMNSYERSLRRKLLLGVYLVPILAIAILVALAQL